MEEALSKYCPACDKEVEFEAIEKAGIKRFHCSECYYLMWVKTADGRFVTGIDYARAESQKIAKLQEEYLKKSSVPPVDAPKLSSLPPSAASVPTAPPAPVEAAVQEPSEPQTPVETAISPISREEATDPAIQIPPKNVIPSLGTVMIVEDSALLRRILADMLLEKKIATNVIQCADGTEFITEYFQRARMNKQPGLAVVDFNMPLMNGAHAGVAVRAIERGLNVSPVPMLFFSAIQADEKIKKLLKYLTKAAFLYKSDSNPNRLADRLAAVITNVSGIQPAPVNSTRPV